MKYDADIEEVINRMYDNFPDCENTEERKEEIGLAVVDLLAMIVMQLRGKGGDKHESDPSVQQEGDSDPLSQS